MGLLHPTRELPRRRSNLKGQGYPAQVIANDDSRHPDSKKRQRVRVRIPQIHRNVPDDQLPWAMPQGQGQANAGGGVGTVDVPPNSAKVMVFYDEEDPHNLYYSNSPTTDDVAGDNELLEQDYPHTKGSIDDAGNKVSVNRKPGKETITDTHQKGQTLYRDEAGNMFLYAPKNLIMSAGGEVIIACKGKGYFHAQGELSMKGSKIHLNGGDGRKDVTVVGARTRPQLRNSTGQTSL